MATDAQVEAYRKWQKEVRAKIRARRSTDSGLAQDRSAHSLYQEKLARRKPFTGSKLNSTQASINEGISKAKEAEARRKAREKDKAAKAKASTAGQRKKVKHK